MERFEDKTPFVAIIVLEVGPNGALPVEIPKHFEPAAALPIEPTPENRPNLACQLLPQLFDHLANDAPGGFQYRPAHHSAKRQHRLEQLVTRFQFLEYLGVGDQRGHTVAIEGVT